jgi:uncharacterized protein YdhG (YjbR/CyaY superfamily)
MNRDVEAYLEKVPEPARTTLQTMRERIRAVAPAEATEAISYGAPAFHYKGPLVGYAAYPEHCSFFPMSGTLLDGFAKELEKYATSKGTIRFPLDKPLPAALVKKLVRAKVAVNERRK